MKAMILCAGFGTRLKPLTLDNPKPLLKIGNETLLSNTINFLEESGIKQIVINTHYLGEQIKKYINDKMLQKLIALVLLILLAPIYMVLSLIIVISDGFPVLYKQKCYGKNNEVFNLYKFRTMKNNTPQIPTEKFDENHSSMYLLKYSKIFRNFSLDELPQVYNVLLGDIKFIKTDPE